MSYTVYLREGEGLVAFDDLSEEEKDMVGQQIFMRLADGIMQPQGYCRAKDACKKEKNSI